MLCLRSAEESSLFFTLIILYCQLKLVLAAYSMRIINPRGPHAKVMIQDKKPWQDPLLCAIGTSASMQKKMTTFLHAGVTVNNLPWCTQQKSFFSGLLHRFDLWLLTQSQRHQPPPLPLFFDYVSLSVFRTCLVPPRD